MNNQAVSTLKKSILILLCAIIIFLVYGFSTINNRNFDLERQLVHEIVTTIGKELSKDGSIQTECYILRREPWEIRIGKISIIEGFYDSAWKYNNGDIESIDKSEWESELSRDDQTLWIFDTSPLLESEEGLCIGLTGILPSSQSVDGKQRRIGSTSWVLNLDSNSGSLERTICNSTKRGFDFLFTH